MSEPHLAETMFTSIIDDTGGPATARLAQLQTGQRKNKTLGSEETKRRDE
jgi:hypothetical protein